MRDTCHFCSGGDDGEPCQHWVGSTEGFVGLRPARDVIDAEVVDALSDGAWTLLEIYEQLVPEIGGHKTRGSFEGGSMGGDESWISYYVPDRKDFSRRLHAVVGQKINLR